MSLFNKIRWSWVAVCVFLFLICVPTYNGTTTRDNDIFLYLLMMALAWPCGWLVLIVRDHITYLQNLQVGKQEMSMLWLCFFAAGYFQWFVIVPQFMRLFRRLRPRLQSGPER